jgi:hypothetical protein
MVRRTLTRLATPLLALGLVATACATEKNAAGEGPSPAATAGESPAAKVAAADLRGTLTGLMTEHVYLASEATGAALRGDTRSFEAYAAALNGPENSNTAELVGAVRSVYGDEVGTAFDGLWRSSGHIPAVVGYTQALAKNDKAGADKAVNDLLAYAKTFGTTMNQVNENLPADAVEAAVKMHVTTLKTVIDAQKAGDATATYAALRKAYGHMGETAAVISDATVRKFPEKFEGAATSSAASLGAGLTSLLREHVFLASSATGAALRGDDKGYTAAATALNGPANSNTADIVAAVTGVYGDQVGKAYLLAYAKTFGTTMNQVNENLPAGAVEDAIKMHATTLKAVIDDQKAGDPAKTVTDLRAAVHHMSDTAGVLAGATVKKFPEKFAG